MDLAEDCLSLLLFEDAVVYLNHGYNSVDACKIQ